MAHIYRAFFAPMPRDDWAGGVPTKVPFLFGNILRRLIKDYQPDYMGIVFDPPGATFRDKLFEKYKAQRQPMPDDLPSNSPLSGDCAKRCVCRFSKGRDMKRTM